ncbi:hypothetical protein fugu_006772, partial [Takifugu bimaculatus]
HWLTLLRLLLFRHDAAEEHRQKRAADLISWTPPATVPVPGGAQRRCRQQQEQQEHATPPRLIQEWTLYLSPGSLESPPSKGRSWQSWDAGL